MDEARDRVTDAERGNGQAEPDDGRAAERTIEDQIGELRGDLTDIVGELDRRRHEEIGRAHV